MVQFRLETKRLILRAWREEDALAHNVLCHDARVAARLGAPPSLLQSREVVERQSRIFAEHGFCFWAMQQSDSPGLIGWCGIVPGKPPIARQIEIGWTLHPDFWRQGLAREAAEATLAWAWSNRSFDSVVAITAATNLPSRGLMSRLGMIQVEHGDFDHPELKPDDPLRRHVLYRIDRPV